MNSHVRMLPSHHQTPSQLRVALLELLVTGGAGGRRAGRRRGTDGRERYAVKVFGAAAQERSVAGAEKHLAGVDGLLLLLLLGQVLWRGGRRQDAQPFVALHRELRYFAAVAFAVLLQNLRGAGTTVLLRRLNRHEIDRVLQRRDGEGRRARVG